jgi:hypothetical protein
MGYSPPQEYTPVESQRTRQIGDVASVSQGALNSFRTEAAADLNNPALVRSLFGASGETSPGQKYWLDDTFGKVSFTGGGNLAFETGVAQTAARTFSGNQNTVDGVETAAENVQTSADATGYTGDLGYLQQLAGQLDRMRGPGRDAAIAQVNKAIGDIQARDATKSLAYSMGDKENPDWLAKTFASPEAYRNYLASIQQT